MTSSTTPSVEETMYSKLKTAQANWDGCLRDGEAYIRTEPLKSVAYAVGVGYVLRVLPIGAIIRSLVKVLLGTLKPAALLYGAAKGYEMLARSQNDKR